MNTITIGSIAKYIKTINNIYKSPEKIIDILYQNNAGPFGFSQELLEKLEKEDDAQKRKEYLSALYNEKYAYTVEFEKHIKAKRDFEKFGIQPKFKFYYRGHYSDKYLLLPSALRVFPEKENYYYKEIITRNPNEFVGSGNLEKLVKMQHYECPTRLLDITSNPLVALYFACKNTGCNRCSSARVGEVIIFATYEEDILSFDSDKALILASLPKFTLEEKRKISYICMEAVSKGEKSLPENKDEIIARLYHEIRREYPAFKDIINPYDILTAFFVQPLKNNNRIIKQEGAFIICGQFYEEKSLMQKLNSFAIARIKIRNKEKLLKELDVLGINEATLFPEVDKVANYLKNR